MARSRKKSYTRIQKAYSMATTSVSLVLFLLGVIGYMAIIVETSVQKIVKGFTITVILEDGLDKGKLSSIETKLKSIEGVDSISYTNKEKAAEEFKKFTGEDFTAFIDKNPLPASFDITIEDDKRLDDESFGQIEEVIKKIEGVDEVLYQRDIMSKINSSINTIRAILIGIIIMLFVISVALINNSINMVLFSRKKLLKTMKLVGATNYFIQKPFIKEAVSQGIMSSFIACSMLSLIIYLAGEFAYTIGFGGLGLKILLILYGSVFATGIIMCLLCTAASVRKYINLSSKELHTY